MGNFIVPAKSKFLSRTVWLGSITTAIALVTTLQSQPWVADYPRVASGCVAVIGVLTVVLRFLTDRPIE